MKRRTAEAVVFWSGAVLFAVFASTVIAAPGVILEYWYLSQLDSDDLVENEIAVERLRALRSVRAAPRLVELFRSPPETARLGYSAVDALVRVAVGAVPALGKALEDESRAVRPLAARTLGRIARTGSVRAALPTLISVLEEQDADVRARAAHALGVAQAEVAVPGLARLLTDYDDHVRAAAARALGRVGPEAKSAVPRLAGALTDRDVYVRESVAEALGHIGVEAREAVPAITRALDDRHPLVRHAAAETLRKIQGE